MPERDEKPCLNLKCYAIKASRCSFGQSSIVWRGKLPKVQSDVNAQIRLDCYWLDSGWKKSGRISVVCTLALIAGVLALTPRLLAQSPGPVTVPQTTPSSGTALSSAPEPQPGTIVGTVLDPNNNTVPGATVLLQGPDPSDRRTVVANSSGVFEMQGVRPGVAYHIVVSAKGFLDWTSPAVILGPGQYKILADCKLQIEPVRTTIDVGPSSQNIAAEQLEREMKQRVFGVFPDFYTVYEPNAEPLTAKLKFKLAFRTVVDPVTIAGVALYAGFEQAANTPDYGQGAEGYGKRVGVVAADGFNDIMIGGAILPSLLHQDPRYFYQGTGTTKSRILHALSYAFVCKGDNGRLQPSYSSMGGDLGSAAIANAYYPDSDRGADKVFENFAISIGERMAAALVKEFLLKKLDKKVGNAK